jgi:DNA-binding response OmpR family regulator
MWLGHIKGCEIETRRVLYLGKRLLPSYSQFEARLAELGCLLSDAADLDEAWRLLSRSHYEAIILEAGADPAEDCLTCRTLRRRWAIPIMVLVVGMDNGRRINLYRAGADVCVAFPVDFNELAARLEVLFRRAAWNMEGGQIGQKTSWAAMG